MYSCNQNNNNLYVSNHAEKISAARDEGTIRANPNPTQSQPKQFGGGTYHYMWLTGMLYKLWLSISFSLSMLDGMY